MFFDLEKQGKIAFRLARLAAPALMLACSAHAASKTLGFVVTNWNDAIYETKFIDECPEGFSEPQQVLWWRALPKLERAKLTDNGMVPNSDRWPMFGIRGSKGNDSCLDPASVNDPPLRTVEGKISYGMNLDGTTDGHATAQSCAHEKFASPDGIPAIDNQYYRVVGCQQGYRSIGYFQANPNESRKMQGLGIILVEISGVDDPRNDDSVEVSFYRSIDGYALDSVAGFVPYGSYRIDTYEGKPRYSSTVHGKIVDGVVITDPADAHMPWFGNYAYQNLLVRGMRMRLALSEDGKEAGGLIAGYQDVDQMMYMLQALGPIHSDTFTNCASTYAAAHKLADGYPDPKTGQCTALSSAWAIKAVAAFIVHPDAPKPPSAGLWARLLARIGIDDHGKTQ